MVAWQLQEAKNRLSELIDRVLAEGAQVITRHGTKVAVVLPYETYRKLTAPSQNLAEFFMASPLRRGGLVVERDKRSDLREVDL